MKRYTWIAVAVFVTTGTVGMTGCKKEATQASQEPVKASSAAVIYTCSMHPEVTSDKPGKCPTCGMELVVKK